MKRKLWLVLALAILAAVWCGTALADGPSFTLQPTGGAIVPDGGRLISWSTDFTPVRVQIGYTYYYDSEYFGGTWLFSSVKELDAGLSQSMQWELPYSSAVASEKWSVRAYYDDSHYKESGYFPIDLISRQFAQSPAGGTIEPEGTLPLSWETNFKPVRVEIGYITIIESSWMFETTTTKVFHSVASRTTGLKKSMSHVLPYNDAVASDQWVVRAYYDEEHSVDSGSFAVTPTGRAFTLQPAGGSVPPQGTSPAQWEVNFVPVKQQLVHKWTTSVTIWFNQTKYYDHEEVIAEFSGDLRNYACPGYEGLVIRAFYNEEGYVDSQKFNVTEAEGTFTQQPQSGLVGGNGTCSAAWQTDFTPCKIEFIRLGANDEKTVIGTWEGANAAVRSGSYPFTAGQGDLVNSKYVIRAAYTNGANQEKTVLSAPFFIGSGSADYRFTVQPEDCYSSSISWSSVSWAVNFLPEKVEYLRGTGTDVSQYSVTEYLTDSEEYSFAIRCYYSVADQLYCTSDPFTVTYYLDAWTKQPEGGAYVVGTKFHLTWELKFRPETIILRYCTPEGHPILLVPEFPLDPDKDYYDMEIESGNPAQYYHICAWLDDGHAVVSDPFYVQQLEDYIFLQEPQDITVPENGSASLTWKLGFTSWKTEVYECAVGDPEQTVSVTQLTYPSETSFEVINDQASRERAFVIRAWYSDTEYVDSRIAVAAQENIDRYFTKNPIGFSLPSDCRLSLSWATNFVPVKTEVWRAPMENGEAGEASLVERLEDPTGKAFTVVGDGSGVRYAYTVRAYYAAGYYVESSPAYINHVPPESCIAFTRQPADCVYPPNGSCTVTWETNFAPAAISLLPITEDGQPYTDYPQSAYVLDRDISYYDLTLEEGFEECWFRLLAYADANTYIYSDPFYVSRYRFTEQPADTVIPLWGVNFFQWDLNFGPSGTEILWRPSSGEGEWQSGLPQNQPVAALAGLTPANGRWSAVQNDGTWGEFEYCVRVWYGQGAEEYLDSAHFTVFQTGPAVSFDKNGGSDNFDIPWTGHGYRLPDRYPMEPLHVNAGESFQVPECTIIPPDWYMFDHWEFIYEGSCVSVNVGDVLTVSNDATLRPVWTDRTFTAAYEIGTLTYGVDDPPSFFVHQFLIPYLPSDMVEWTAAGNKYPYERNIYIYWYSVVDGVRGDLASSYMFYSHSDYGPGGIYVQAMAPGEVGDYELVITYKGVEVINQFWSFVESEAPQGEHNYLLLIGLDKEYDSEPVAFDPYDGETLIIDKGAVSWGALEKSGAVRYLWRCFTDMGKIQEWIDLDEGDVPTLPGRYQLVIQEQGGEDWIDAAAFAFEITGSIPYEPHQYQLASDVETSKVYDGNWLDFSYDWLVIDGGETTLEDLLDMGVWVQYSWSVYDPGAEGWETIYYLPQDIGLYRLLIQEGSDWNGWHDAAAFDFEITDEAPSAFTVSFDVRGGAPAVPDQTAASGETAQEPAAPMKIGAVFTGWHTDAACAADTLYSFGTAVTADITLYAGWLTPEPDGVLKLPATLKKIGANAFKNVDAEAAVIPVTVTSITGDPFAGSAVRYIYGYVGSAGETLANSFGYIFVPIDDAWLESN